MITICHGCHQTVETDGVLKGEKAFEVKIEIDTEPHMNTACVSRKTIHLCYSCLRRLKNYLELKD
jgi:hypothetical protein